MITIEDALRIALEAHDGQKDLDGNPVILHPMTVAAAGRNREEQIAGLLHDVVEDTDFTFDELLRRGVDETVVDALRLLTHDKEQMTYEEYVQRIATSGNDIAIHVKYNDLCHNLKRGRAGGHLKQVTKHEKALAIIEPLIQSNMKKREANFRLIDPMTGKETLVNATQNIENRKSETAHQR